MAFGQYLKVSGRRLLSLDQLQLGRQLKREPDLSSLVQRAVAAAVLANAADRHRRAKHPGRRAADDVAAIESG